MFVSTSWRVGVALLLTQCFSASSSTLLSSSQLQFCVNSGNVTCAKNFVVTLAVDGGNDATESVVYWSTAVDASTGSVVRLTDPVTISVSKSRPRIVYPLYYQRNFNAAPYESVVFTGLFGCQDSSSFSSPTCGRAFDSAGTPIPYSEGYCCSCSLCDIIGLALCDGNSRANTQCSLLGDAQAASCLRFSQRWYSGYSIGAAQTSYTITVNISTSKQWRVLSVGPDVLGASSPLFDVRARLVGDFASFKQVLDLKPKMLFVPAAPAGDERIAAGVAEWMIVPTSMVTLGGTECNKVGVSYEGFASQGSRCTMRAGSCTSNQLEALRSADVSLLAAGRSSLYFASSYGEFSIESSPAHRLAVTEELLSENMNHSVRTVRQQMASHTVSNAKKAFKGTSTTPFISYALTDVSASVLTLTFVADNMSYTINNAAGRIIAANLSTSRFSSNSRDGVLYVTIMNVGTVSADFSLSVVGCSAGTFPMTAKAASIPALGVSSLTFSVVAAVAVTATASCNVTLFDALSHVVDVVVVTWIASPVNQTDGAQGGIVVYGGGSAVVYSSDWNSVSCPACMWYNPLCFLQQQCFWGMVFQLAGVVVLLCFLFCLLRVSPRLIKSCCGHCDLCESSSSESNDSEKVKRRRRRMRRRREHRNEPV